MKKIARFRSRLADLTADRVEALRSSPAAALATCRQIQDQLRDLKREVLDQLVALRGQAADHARRALGTRPSPGGRNLRSEAEAKSLLGEVKQLLDDKSAKAVPEWAGINREIDKRLERLAELELSLARTAGEIDFTPLPPPPGRERDGADESDDDLYAAVGTAVQQGANPDATFCPHCGRTIEPADRFCRRCGHHLRR